MYLSVYYITFVIAVRSLADNGVSTWMICTISNARLASASCNDQSFLCALQPESSFGQFPTQSPAPAEI